MSYCIFQASNNPPYGSLSATLTSFAGPWLLCFAALFGAAANASASIGLRITLGTSGIPNTQPPFGASSTLPSAAEREAAAAAKAELREQIQSKVKIYAAKSDTELTALAAQLQELPRLDQKVLLREVKMRMARQRGRKGVLQIRTERRFGRLLRQADGSVVRVETRVVRVRPATKGEQTSQVRVRKSGYGTGYERRSTPSVPVSAAATPLDAQSLPPALHPEIGADPQP